MLLAISTYLKPLHDIDPHRKKHLAYLQSLVDQGALVCSGRQTPALGGVIIVHSLSKEEFAQFLEKDPFVTLGLARYDIVEFTPTLCHPKLEALLKSAC